MTISAVTDELERYPKRPAAVARSSSQGINIVAHSSEARLNRSAPNVGHMIDGEPTEAAMARKNLSPDLPQRWRLRTAGSGREVVLAASPGVRYLDRYSGEEMEAVGRLLPLAPSPSLLPWAEQNLRFCPTCDQLVQKDLNYCPYDGRPLPPLERHPATDPDEPTGSS